MNASRKEQRCLDKLMGLIDDGVEFPDAVWKASNNGMDIDAARLGDLYDAACKARAPSIDECVRSVTAFESFDDLKSSEAGYAPTFYPGKGNSPAEIVAMERVCAAFNAWAERVGRSRRAWVRRIQAAGEQRRGPF